MTNEELYKGLNQENPLKKSSNIGIIPRDPNSELSYGLFKSRLQSNTQFKIEAFEETTATVKEDIPELLLSFDIKFNYKENGETYNAQLFLMPTDNLHLTSMDFVNAVDSESIDIALKAPRYIESSMQFIDKPIEDFLVQLKLLHTLVPSTAIGIDFSSLRVFSPYWLKMTAESTIPPAPDYLYSLHSVYKEEESGRAYWLHTHGLHRCGSIEFEMLVNNYPQEMYDLIKSAALNALDRHFKEDEPFQVGYDGMGLNLKWQRWEEALNSFKPDVLGGYNDRIEEDGTENTHAEPSGILLAVEDGEASSPEIYGPTLKNNPIFYISDSETTRMRALAKERFHFFKELFAEKGPKKRSFLKKLIEKEPEKWSFLVKLGLTVDNAQKESDQEHLWFEVEGIDEQNRVTGKLLNAPYWIAALKEGDVKTYPVAKVLTDWIIYSPQSQYTPDSIYAYYHS